jgi:GNAT superfamily N-acetyltransferase
MCDEWMPAIKLELAIEQFRQLPRNAAYKYEYLDGTAFLSPRARHYHALLELESSGPLPGIEMLSSAISLRAAREEDFGELEPVFAGAFHSIQPFGSLDDDTRRKAAHKCLEKTRTGGDGPWIERASFVALREGQLIGAILLTLLPEGDPRDGDSYYWREPPPDDCIARRRGRPHLTWILVAPWFAGHGIGTALLSAAVKELRALGFTQLLSTFMLGNDSSMLWHWRNGFRLLAHPASIRLFRERHGLKA